MRSAMREVPQPCTARDGDSGVTEQLNENTTSQRGRREVLRNDTYLSRAQADADLPVGGRFAKELATQVIGVPQYPAQPATSPWSVDPVPAEPPLGFAIDAMPVEGEPQLDPVSDISVLFSAVSVRKEQ